MSTPTQPVEWRPARAKWSGFVLWAACMAWMLNLFANYIISGHICAVRGGRVITLDGTWPRTVTIVITIVLLAVAVGAGISSYRSWRRVSDTSRLLDAEAREWKEFLALGGILVSSGLAAGLLWAGIPLMFVNMCMRVR